MKKNMRPILLPFALATVLLLGGCGSAATTGGAVASSTTGSTTDTTPGSSSQTPANAGFLEEDITLGEGDWAVKGMLCLPAEKSDGKPFPVVVMVGGSGPNDMDETIYGNKPFRDIAQGLAQKGVASVRYNKISKQNPKVLQKAGAGLTVNEEYLPNVRDAVAYAAKETRLDTNKIFVLGHSLGGTVLPRIAKAESLPAGFIFMAGSNAFLGDELLRQYNYLFNLDKNVDQEEKTAIAQVEAELAKLKPILDGSEAPGTKSILGAPAAYWKDLYDQDPLKLAVEITKPVLILQGDRDYNVLPDSAEKWQTSLTGSKDVTLKHYADLNHLMLSGTGPDDPVHLTKPRVVDDIVIRDLSEWVHSH